MEKTLITSDKEFVDLVISLLRNQTPETIEEVSGVEFPAKNGWYLSEIGDNDMEEFDKQEIDFTTFKKRDETAFPESYPCLAVHHFENEHDRYGRVEFRLMKFLYPSDFKQETIG